MPRGVSAQTGSNHQSTGLSVGPALFEVVLKPGETASKAIRVKNTTDRPLPITASKQRLTPNEPEIDPTLVANFDASSWISLSDTDFIFQPQETRTIIATITVPDSAEPGGHYGTIFFEVPVPPQGTAQTGSQTAPRVGATAFITVPGELHEDISVKSPPKVPLATSSFPSKATVAIANRGNIHNFVTPKVTVRNWRGKVIAEKSYPPVITLPNTERTLSLAELPPHGLGIYRITLDLHYGSGGERLVAASGLFVVAPIAPIMLAAITLAGFVFIRRTRTRWPKVLAALRGKTEH